MVNGLDVGCAREESNNIPRNCPEQLGKWWYYLWDRQHGGRRELGRGGRNELLYERKRVSRRLKKSRMLFINCYNKHTIRKNRF